MIRVLKKSLFFSTKAFLSILFAFWFSLFGIWRFIYEFFFLLSVCLHWPHGFPGKCFLASQSLITALFCPLLVHFLKNTDGLPCETPVHAIPPSCGSLFGLKLFPRSAVLSILPLSFYHFFICVFFFFFLLFGFDRLQQGETESWNEQWIRDGFGSKARSLHQIL